MLSLVRRKEGERKVEGALTEQWIAIVRGRREISKIRMVVGMRGEVHYQEGKQWIRTVVQGRKGCKHIK